MKNRISILAITALALVTAAVLDWPVSFPGIGKTMHKVASVKVPLAATIEGRYEQEFLMTRDPSTNTVPRERLLTAYRIAQEKRAEMALAERAIPIYWQERGPNNVGGRTRGLIFDANDATGHTVWAAGVAGGLWRTTNIEAAAPTWNLVDDFFANLAITTIAQDPANTNILYFGTGGEGTPFQGNNGIGNIDAVQGFGIWRTLNGGTNWARLPMPDDAFLNVAKIVVTNAGRVFAATRNGIWSSNDSGINWTLEPFPVNSGRVQDLEIAANGNIFAAINGAGVFRLQSGAWTQVAAGLPASGFARIELACAPSNGNRVYALFGAPSPGGCIGIFTTTNGGNNWNPCTNPNTAPAATPPASSNFGRTQAWYDLAVAVDPNNESRIFIGAVDLLVSPDAGANWTQISQWAGNGFQYVHADHHTIVFRAGNSNEMIFGNDGGVWYSTDGTAATPAIAARNTGYNVTQFYANAIHPMNGSNYMLGGAQDNGTPRFNAAGLTGTTEAGPGGDGAFCFIDQDNANIQVVCTQFRRFYTSNNGGGSFSPAMPSKRAALFITPADYDDANDILYFSDNTDTLGRMTGVGAANTVSLERIAAFGGGQISSITVSPNTSDRIFAGTDNGRIVRIDNADVGTFTATALTSPRNGAYITCIAVQPGTVNDANLIATCSNYGAAGQVFESNDGGTTWTNLTNDLPDMPVRWAMFHPFDTDKMLLATELGVWSTDDLDGVSTEWWPTNNFGLANVRVDMFQYRPSDHLVVAATHGRGMYSTDYFSMLNTCVPNLNVTGAVAAGIYMAEDFIVSDGAIAPGRKVIYHAGNYIRLTPGFHAQASSDFWALIEGCNLGPIALKQEPAEQRGSLPAGANGRERNEQDHFGELALRCYPNPASYRLFVEYDLPANGSYSLYVRDIQGRLIETFASETGQLAGRYKIELDARNYQAGIYVLTLQSVKHAVTERFMVMR